MLKYINEIQEVLKNNCLSGSWPDYEIKSFKDLYCEICDVNEEIPLKIFIKVQNELPNYEIIISGSYSCGIILSFNRINSINEIQT